MELRSWLEPLLRKVLVSIQQETVEDWTQCVSDISVSLSLSLLNFTVLFLYFRPIKTRSVFVGYWTC